MFLFIRPRATNSVCSRFSLMSFLSHSSYVPFLILCITSRTMVSYIANDLSWFGERLCGGGEVWVWVCGCVCVPLFFLFPPFSSKGYICTWQSSIISKWQPNKTLKNTLNFLLLFFMCMSVLPTYTYFVSYVCLVPAETKRVWDTLKLELQRVCELPCECWDANQILSKSRKYS